MPTPAPPAAPDAADKPAARRARAATAPLPKDHAAGSRSDALVPTTADEEEAAREKAPAIPTNWRGRFISHLGATSNVSAAARHARVPIHIVYKHRRTDPNFRAAWFAALAEGYDNLEMELLQHLRGFEGEAEGGAPASAKRPGFDTATAFRCLTAHRESVAREKGRRTLADEAATIAAINEKIDRLRLNARASDKAIAAARKTVRAAHDTKDAFDAG